MPNPASERKSEETSEIAQLRKDVTFWKAAHDEMVRRNKELRDRPDLGDRAKSLEALYADCKTLAEEVRLRRATPESSPGEIWEAMEAVDASSALTRHAGDGT